LTTAIDNLQQQNLPLSKSIEVVQDIKRSFETFSDQNGKTVNKKLHQVLEKNSGLLTLIKISNILMGEETSGNLDGLPEDLNSNDLVFFKNAPITSVDVERSFSTYKTIISDNRRS